MLKRLEDFTIDSRCTADLPLHDIPDQADKTTSAFTA